MSAGFWNVNGFSKGKQSDNYKIRENCIRHFDLDIIGVSETHLKDNDSIDFEGYTWFANNRSNTHINAWSGSGGVAFLVKNTLFNNFEVSICDKSNEGILWLKLKHKYDDFYLFPCVCYLPPKYSTRQIDVNTFYDSILANIFDRYTKM